MIDVDNYFVSFNKGAKKPSLDAMYYFMEKYNNFEKNMKFIHIAGTNGKGSCTEMISNILIKQGYKVGKFISPHLIRYNERISINGNEISNQEISDLIEELEPLIKKYNEYKNENITFFELITIMALLYFYRKNVDFVVLETGLGGLYDCTNVITKPLVSIITSIGYDHVHILGDTLEKIAYQKAGIIKENSNTVIFEQEQEVDKIFIDECKKKNNNLHILSKKDISNCSFDKDFQYFDYKDIKNVCINLKGKVQIKNASLCIETIQILNKNGFKIDMDKLLLGLKTVVHKGRMEKINDNPIVIYDGAHNEPAINNLLDMVNMYYKDAKRVYIVSILARKDYKKMLELLSQDENAVFIMTSGNDNKRFVGAQELYDSMIKLVGKDRVCKMDFDVAIDDIIKNNEEVVNLVVGSFYVYSTVMEKLKT